MPSTKSKSRPKSGGGGTAVYVLRSKVVMDINARTRQRAAAFPPCHVAEGQRRDPYAGLREDYIAPGGPAIDCTTNAQLKAAIAAGVAANVEENLAEGVAAKGKIFSVHAWENEAEYSKDYQRFIDEEHSHITASGTGSSRGSNTCAAAAYFETVRRAKETVPFVYNVAKDVVVVGSNDGPVRIMNKKTGKLLVATIKVMQAFFDIPILVSHACLCQQATDKTTCKEDWEVVHALRQFHKPTSRDSGEKADAAKEGKEFHLEEAW